jgi:hypothetical protein
MLTLFMILAVGALIATIMAAMGKCPLYVPVMVLSVIEVLRVLPLS